MKILIIGKNSYIGNHIDNWLTKYGHEVEQLDVLTEDWRAYDYSPHDAIVHVAGIVHRPDCQDWKLYKAVNCDMPVAIASRYKSSRSSKGLNGEYVFFSTMGVYDAGKQLKPSLVDENTPLLKEGNSMYGKSKVMAEEGLMALQSNAGSRGSKSSSIGANTNPTNEGNKIHEKFVAIHDNSYQKEVNKDSVDSCNLCSTENDEPIFNVAIVRPPSVYGKGCRGGYITGFKKIASLMPIIPRAYENVCQSFIYIDNLSECVRLIAENHLNGAFCPQDDEIPNANRLLEVISKGIGKKYRSSKFLGLCLRMVSFIPLVKKAYGGIEYSRTLSDIHGMNYVVVPFEEGMERSVK